MRVLLVDDEHELVCALAERLGFRGVRADYAVSAVQALELARATAYDIAVLDVKMPGMGGLELHQKLRELQPDLRAVFLTGHGSELDFAAGAARGEAYLVKPVGIEVLMETFARIVGAANGPGGQKP